MKRGPVALLLLIAILLIPGASALKYSIPAVDSILVPDASASLAVAERLEFHFEEGVFNNAFREIPHAGFDKLEAAAVVDSNGTQLAQGSFYRADTCNGFYRVSWFFNDTKSPATKNFYIGYRFSNALVSPSAYQSGIDWYVIGPEWPHLAKYVNASVKLTGNVTSSPLFTYSPRPGTKVEVDIKGDTWVHFRGRNVSAGSGYRVTVYFPRVAEYTLPLDRILRENQLLAAIILGILLSLPAALRTGVKESRRAFARLPDSFEPLAAALVSSLLHPRARTVQFALATSELSRRGYLVVTREKEANTAAIALATEEPPPDLAAHERIAFEEGAERGSVREIGMHFAGIGRRFRRSVDDDAVAKGLYSRRPLPVFLPLLVTGTVLIIVGGVIWYYLLREQPYWAVVFCGVLAGLIAGGAAILAVGGLLGSYRTWEGDRLAGEWAKRAKEYKRRETLEPQERLWMLAGSRGMRAAVDADERKERGADDHTPRMSWFTQLEG